jgi:hypothetical protein
MARVLVPGINDERDEHFVWLRRDIRGRIYLGGDQARVCVSDDL